MSLLEALGQCIDKFGLITQTAQDNWDGGDTAQREGMFAIAVRHLYDLDKIKLSEYLILRQRYWDSLNELECGWGNYRRHIDPSMWYFDSNRMSRDQWTPNAIAVGMLDLYDHRKRMFWGHGKRLWLFTTNTRRNHTYPPGHPKHAIDQDYSWKLPDLTLFSSWGYYIRSYKAYPAYPLLLLFDVDLLVGSLIWRWKFKNKPTDTDILNHCNGLIQAQKRMSTPLSWLARKIMNVDTVLSKLEGYFKFDGPRLDLVFKDFLKEIW